MVYWARGHELKVHFAGEEKISFPRDLAYHHRVIAGVVIGYVSSRIVNLLTRKWYLRRMSGIDQLFLALPVCEIPTPPLQVLGGIAASGGKRLHG